MIITSLPLELYSSPLQRDMTKNRSYLISLQWYMVYVYVWGQPQRLESRGRLITTEPRYCNHFVG